MWLNTLSGSHTLLQWRTQYVSNTPISHIFLPHFLVQKRYASLKTALLNESFYPKSSDLFDLSQTSDLRTAKQPLLRDFQRFLSSSEMHELISAVTDIKTRGQVDAFGSLYTDTDYLLPHDDRLESRKVAFVFYLSTLTRSDGGELAFFETDRKHNPTKEIKLYRPKENALLLFTVSKRSWHCVREIRKPVKRYAIGGWFHG